MDLVKAITSDHDLLKLAKRIGVHIDDVLDSSEIKKAIPKKGSYLILLRPEDIDVGHWVCVVDGHWFDSMGEGPPKAMGKLKYNEKQVQSAYGSYCGIWCLLWMYAKQHHDEKLFHRFHDLNVKVLG